MVTLVTQHFNLHPTLLMLTYDHLANIRCDMYYLSNDLVNNDEINLQLSEYVFSVLTRLDSNRQAFSFELW